MDLSVKTHDELRAIARRADLSFGPNLGPDGLITLIEADAFRKKVIAEEEVRAEIRAEALIRQGVAEIQVESENTGIEIVIPEKPTLKDITRLKKQLGMEIKKPKPSPEEDAIRKSKKVYATFVNLEDEDLDVVSMPGGIRFHCWPGKRHVIPEWLIKYHDQNCKRPEYGRRKDPRTGNEVSVMVGSKPRFLWQVHGDAPADAEFGVILEDLVAV